MYVYLFYYIIIIINIIIFGKGGGYNCTAPLEFLLWKIRFAFPGKASRD